MTKSEKKYEKEKKIAIDKMQEILKEHSMEIYISGCGCFGSPTVAFKYKGKYIMKATNSVWIDMMGYENS